MRSWFLFKVLAPYGDWFVRAPGFVYEICGDTWIIYISFFYGVTYMFQLLLKFLSCVRCDIRVNIDRISLVRYKFYESYIQGIEGKKVLKIDIRIPKVKCALWTFKQSFTLLSKPIVENLLFSYKRSHMRHFEIKCALLYFVRSLKLISWTPDNIETPLSDLSWTKKLSQANSTPILNKRIIYYRINTDQAAIQLVLLNLSP